MRLRAGRPHLTADQTIEAISIIFSNLFTLVSRCKLKVKTMIL